MRSGLVRFWLAAAASVLAAGSAAAQQAPDDEVTVTGQREIPPKVAQRYVAEISAGVDGQLTRFRVPVCPTVIGIADDYARIIAKRIRAVARDVGAPLADANCRGNLVVIFAKDGDALIKQMRAKTPRIFEGVDDVDLKRAFREGPVHAWNTTEILNEDGQRPTGGTMTVKSASILYLPTQQAISGSMIVLDHEATLGKTLNQLGDYVAMRALAGALPPRKGVPADTILTLFDATDTLPPQLSAVDRSYLRGLYHTSPMMKGRVAKGRISRQIQNDAKERAGVN
ncbi:hypothetical protein FHS95_001742 [Sphingomonas naasensis]|uniref:DUF2927 domain-containing protein n=1 Tax=Sphingomonas naasensis TaxID=1344951 RepID=A0A4V3QWX0_9SPHN|nr:hypothetical protein [Sphingomonas naasensis]NIJ20050.1 hypothetical protein [Sphingomonas naasensis]TGX44212.1 hypothetical protein E5A74_05230 [Sphingomonas naasensis]